MPNDAPLTKAGYAAHQLREQILSGTLTPGERLRVEQLTQDLSMSPTPIREALRVLQAEGLITQRPHHGMVVANPSADDFQEICGLRVMLEPLAVERAVPRMDQPTLTKLDEIHKQLVAAAERDDARETMWLNREWHWLIYRTAGSPRLEDLIQRLWNALPWGLVGTIPGRIQRSAAEHVTIHEAIRQGDTRAAAAHMRKHISGADRVVQLLRDLERQQ